MNVALLVSVTIWQCLSADGNVTFTDQACPARQASSIANQAPITRLAPLPPNAMERVAEIDRRTEQQLLKHNRRRVKHRQSQQQSAADRQKACAQAESDLRKLASRRRQGYRLTEAVALDQREAELRKLRRQYCR